MCGIVVIYSLNNTKIPDLKSRLKKMIELIDYRGPDNTGYYINDTSSFGMVNNQLSIVSPNKKIKLPLTYDGNTFLSFNGEIYNYLDLKDKYKIEDKKFIYKTDTEILYNFLNNKSKNFSDLNGAWVFAFYDKNKHVLQLGRDTLGERNLYYYIDKNELIFSSEIRPIFKANKIKFSIDNVGLQDMWKYYSCRDNKTVIKDCFKLTPGKLKVFDPKNKKLGISKEIELPILEIDKYSDFFLKSTNDEILQKFKDILFEEINLRFPKLVNLYSFLSGGIDSSFQNSILNKNEELNTLYAISSEFNSEKRKEVNISEVQLSRLVSKEINSRHTIVDLREKCYSEALRVSKNTLETLDPSILNFSMLAKKINYFGTKVAFASDGPDEFLCGYERDILNYHNNKKDFIKIPQHKIIREKNFYRSIFQKVERDTTFFSEPDNRYKKYFKKIDLSQFKALTYATKSLPEFINIRADKGFMLNSVEVRQPYLSRKIVEFLCGLPKEFRLHKKKKIGKVLLRNAFKKNLQLVRKFPKAGFGKNIISDEKVFRKMSNQIDDTINDKKVLDKIYFKKSSVKLFLKENSSQKMMLFSLIRSINNLS